MASVLTLEAKLERTDKGTPWGFRMQGGKDFSSPLTIQKVNPGSLAAKCGLQVGDIILKIGSTATGSLLHSEAQSNILQSGNHLDLLLQRGGSGGYERFNGPTINTNLSNNNSSWSSPTYSPSSSTSQNFNSAARPFGHAPPAPRSNYEASLSSQTSNMSISSPSKPVPDYQYAAEKYTEREDAPDPAKHQSKSFKFLANAMEEGRELNSALRPRQPSPSPKSPTVSQSSSSYHPEPSHTASVAPTPIGPGNKPGTVKAIVSQRYNNPIGLYSNENASTQFEGQSKFLMDKDDSNGPESPDAALPSPPPPLDPSEYDDQGRKRYVPSQTFMAVQEEVGLKAKEEEPGPAHSRTFKMLQQQLNSGGHPSPVPAPTMKPANNAYNHSPASAMAPSAPAAKPFSPAPAVIPPVSNAMARPFGSSAPPKPTGKGATRGNKGDATMNTAVPPTGRIPVCSGCNMPIRGPFVTALGKCWCPDHFVCANPQCGTKLLDIGFVEEGGFLYCERDYAQHFAPHCDKCGQAIIGECVNALQKSFHPTCFLCTQCNQPIMGTNFYIEEGKFYCEADWQAMFQTMCHGCEFPIEPGDKWVEAMGKNFHSECFNCSACQVNLEGQQFCAKNGKPYCKKHAR